MKIKMKEEERKAFGTRLRKFEKTGKKVMLRSGKEVAPVDLDAFLISEGAMNAQGFVKPRKYEEVMDKVSECFFFWGREEWSERQRLLSY